MLKKTITYTDYNGNSRTEDFWFNFSKAELLEMELSIDGGLSEMIKKISSTQNVPEIAKIFKELVLKSYGEKSADGRRFEKSEEKTREFSQTEAYSVLYMELATNSNKAAEFMEGIIPSDLKSQLDSVPKLNN